MKEIGWKTIVSPGSDDDSEAINIAIAELVTKYKGGTIYLEPKVYNLQSSILGASNIKIKGAFNGSHLFDNSILIGTVLRWTAPIPGAVIYAAPQPEAYKIDNFHVSNLSIDGGFKASIGTKFLSTYYSSLSHIHCVGMTSYAFYCGTSPTTKIGPNYHTKFDNLSACVLGNTHGIGLDGIPGGGRNTCFLSARNCHITYQNGIAYVLANCDDCSFLDCAASRINGSTGTAIWFGGTSDGSFRAATSNRFMGFHPGNGAIIGAGGTYPSRGNYVLTNAMDGRPVVWADKAKGATLRANVFDGEIGFDGFQYP